MFNFFSSEGLTREILIYRISFSKLFGLQEWRPRIGRVIVKLSGLLPFSRGPRGSNFDISNLVPTIITVPPRFKIKNLPTILFLPGAKIRQGLVER